MASFIRAYAYFAEQYEPDPFFDNPCAVTSAEADERRERFTLAHRANLIREDRKHGEQGA